MSDSDKTMDYVVKASDGQEILIESHESSEKNTEALKAYAKKISEMPVEKQK